MSIKLEKGKAYRTRDGVKATCICDNRKCDHGYTCVLLAHRESGDDVRTYTAGGIYGGPLLSNSYDIISEWRDEPVISDEVRNALKMLGFEWVAQEASGKWVASEKEPSMKGAFWFAEGREVYIKPEMVSFTGDWRESKFKL